MATRGTTTVFYFSVAHLVAQLEDLIQVVTVTVDHDGVGVSVYHLQVQLK